jgi:hypothetical protein
MEYTLKTTLLDRKFNNKCGVCGEEISFKEDPFRDYLPIVHKEVGELLVHARHLK